MQGQTKRHDVCAVFREVQSGRILRKGSQIHFEEIDVERAVDVVEFVPVLLFKVLLIHFLKVVSVIRALRVDALVDPETGTVFDRNERVTAAGTFYQETGGRYPGRINCSFYCTKGRNP